MATGGQRRHHDLIEMLGSVGGHHQRFGAGADSNVGGVEQQLTEAGAEPGTAGLPGQDGAEALGQDRSLGALARTLAPLERDVDGQ